MCFLIIEGEERGKTERERKTSIGSLLFVPPLRILRVRVGGEVLLVETDRQTPRKTSDHFYLLPSWLTPPAAELSCSEGVRV